MHKGWGLTVIALIVALGALSATFVAARSGVPTSTTSVPTTVSFQGTVSSNGQAFNGTGHFKFAIVNTAGSQAVWTNDGSNLSTAPFTPTASVPLSVTNGVFSVLLGDTTHTGMTQSLAPATFSVPDRAVRVWFDDGVHGFQQLSPDAPLASVPFAFNAQTLGGLDSSAFAPISHTHSEYLTRTLADTLYDHRPPNMILVAPVRGDFTSIQAAINSAINPTATNPYLIVVAPGLYTESITLKPYVDVQGSGVNLTTITHDGSAPTVTGADHSELRSLTVINTGGGNTATGIANINTSPTLRDLVVQVSGGLTNTGVYQAVSGYEVSGLDPGGSFRQIQPLLVNSRIVVSGGLTAYGLYNVASISTAGGSEHQTVTLTTTVQSSEVEVTGSATNHGLYNATSVNTGGAAMYNVVGTWLDMRDSQASVSGNGVNYGVYSTHSENIVGGPVGNVFGTWTILQNATVSVAGSASNFGLYHAGVVAGDDHVQHSQIIASTATITGAGGAARVGASQLSGGPAGGIALTCAGVYDENYVFLVSTCP